MREAAGTAPATLERVRRHLVGLRMPRALEALADVVQQLERGESSALEAVEVLLAEELGWREGRRVKAALRMARLGAVKTLDSFDFSLCQCGYDGTNLLFGDWALFDIASKRLVPGRIRYGTSSLRRIIKYTRQGFSICSGGLAHMLEQIAADPSIIQAEVEYVD